MHSPSPVKERIVCMCIECICVSVSIGTVAGKALWSLSTDVEANSVRFFISAATQIQKADLLTVSARILSLLAGLSVKMLATKLGDFDGTRWCTPLLRDKQNTQLGTVYYSHMAQD